MPDARRQLDDRQAARRLRRRLLRRFQGRIAGRIELAPSLRWKLAQTPFDIDRPSWIEDEQFDLDRHMLRGALPEPHDFVTAQRARRLAARDGAQPRAPAVGDLRLRRDADGEAAIYSKMHHALIDGGAGAALAEILYERRRAGRAEPRRRRRRAAGTGGGEEARRARRRARRCSRRTPSCGARRCKARSSASWSCRAAAGPIWRPCCSTPRSIGRVAAAPRRELRRDRDSVHRRDHQRVQAGLDQGARDALGAVDADQRRDLLRAQLRRR